MPADFYALDNPANLFIYQGQQRALQRALAQEQMFPLAGRRILDIGCGRGQWLGLFAAFAADPDGLAAIELDSQRAAAALRRFPEADIRVGNAAELPWPDQSFDIVSQSTVFTSVLDPRVKRLIADEMLRVMRPGGRIVWYDFLFNNPRNPHVRGIGRREIGGLFKGCRVRFRRVTLAPPLARRVVPLSWPLARLLEQFRVMNTHYLAIVRRDS